MKWIITALILKQWSHSPQFLWLLIIAYTGLLPWAVKVWIALLEKLGKSGTELVPFVMVALMILVILIMAITRHLRWQDWLLLATAIVMSAGLALLISLPAKLIHLPEYILMAFLVNHALTVTGGLRKQTMYVVIVCVLLGIMDETLQGLIPSRFFALQDIFVNGLSAVIRIMIFSGLRILPASRGIHRFQSNQLAWSLIQLGLLCLVLLQVQINIWNSKNGFADLLLLHGGLLIIWVVLSMGWFHWRIMTLGESPISVIFYITSGILCLYSIGILTGMSML